MQLIVTDVKSELTEEVGFVYTVCEMLNYLRVDIHLFTFSFERGYILKDIISWLCVYRNCLDFPTAQRMMTSMYMYVSNRMYLCSYCTKCYHISLLHTILCVLGSITCIQCVFLCSVLSIGTSDMGDLLDSDTLFDVSERPSQTQPVSWNSHTCTCMCTSQLIYTQVQLGSATWKLIHGHSTLPTS